MRMLVTITISVIALLVSLVSAYFNYYPYEEIIIGSGADENQYLISADRVFPTELTTLVINRGSRPFVIKRAEVSIITLEGDANANAIRKLLPNLGDEIGLENFSSEDASSSHFIGFNEPLPLAGWEQMREFFDWESIYFSPVPEEAFFKNDGQSTFVIGAHTSRLIDLTFDPMLYSEELDEKGYFAVFLVTIGIDGIDNRGRSHSIVQPAFIGARGSLLGVGDPLSDTFIWVGFSFDANFKQLFVYNARQFLSDLFFKPDPSESI